MQPYVRWYSIAVWFGAAVNLAFCLTAWFAPERILKALKLDPTARTMWLRNVGMLLVNLSLFNIGAALDPLRYPLFSWLVPIARLIASFFFFQIALNGMRHATERPKSYIPLMLFDFSMGVICSFLLYRGGGGRRAKR
jgi:hypothetical protein